MNAFPPSMKDLIRAFNSLPGVGPKTAERFAFHVLRSSADDAAAFSKALTRVKESVRFCKVCNNLSDSDICCICSSSTRNKELLCVVEEPNDIFTIEKASTFNGLYHVLLGALSPLEGIGPGDLKVQDLIERTKRERFKEIVIATNFNSEGEATALYLSKILRDMDAVISRVAYGIPVGGVLEYADQATLSRAFEGRRTLS